MLTTLMILCILLGLGAIYLFLLAPGRRRRVAPFDRAKFAHRGLHSGDGRVPENSLAAFRRARQAGYGVELDIQLTADNQVVVFHDATLKRMCGADVRVDSLTYDELQAYSLLGSDQRIPLLTEVLEELDTVPLVCEFKSHGGIFDTILCEEALPILDRYDGPWCMESFNPFLVRWFQKMRPDVLRGLLSKRYEDSDGLPRWQRLLLGSLMTNVLCRPHFIAFCHTDARSFGFRACRWLFQPLCLAWTVKSASEEQNAKNSFDTVIFESYQPEAAQEIPPPRHGYKNVMTLLGYACAVLCFVAVVGTALSRAIPRLIHDSKEAERIEYGTPTMVDLFEDDMAAEALQYINDARKTAGMHSLRVDNGALAKAAKTRAKELTVFFAHERPQGQSWETAFDQFAVPGKLRGENLASGQATAAAVYNSWWNSESHKANMLNKDYTYTSLVCLEYDGTYYWVQLFR